MPRKNPKRKCKRTIVQKIMNKMECCPPSKNDVQLATLFRPIKFDDLEESTKKSFFLRCQVQALYDLIPRKFMQKFAAEIRPQREIERKVLNITQDCVIYSGVRYIEYLKDRLNGLSDSKYI